MTHRVLTFTLIFCSGCTQPRLAQCSNEQGYIYDAKSKNLSEVFNLNLMQMNIQSKSSANITETSSEFSGPFYDCGDKMYYCISGALNILIPKGPFTAKWASGSMVCSLLSFGNIEAEIECKSTNINTIARYSAGRGITEYWRVSEPDDVVYILRGRCGIFSEAIKH